MKKVKEEETKPKSKNRELGPLDVQCQLCETVMTASSYEGHMRRVHGEKINMSKKCHWCDNVVSVYNLDWHARKHHFWGIFVCTECNFKCNFASNLVAHMNEEHPEYDQALCPSCRERCPVRDFEEHYKECITRKVSQKAEYKKDMKEKEACVCETCGKSFKYKQQYKNHLKNHIRDQGSYLCDVHKGFWGGNLKARGVQKYTFLWTSYMRESFYRRPRVRSRWTSRRSTTFATSATTSTRPCRRCTATSRRCTTRSRSPARSARWCSTRGRSWPTTITSPTPPTRTTSAGTAAGASDTSPAARDNDSIDT